MRNLDFSFIHFAEEPYESEFSKHQVSG